MSPAGDSGAAGMEPFMGSPAAPADITHVPELPVTLEQVVELTGVDDNAYGFALVILTDRGQRLFADTCDARQVAHLLSSVGRQLAAGLGGLQ
ncbi:MAG: hypothetical protein ACYCPF_22240 [Streptosporangiaceae bacterium]